MALSEADKPCKFSTYYDILYSWTYKTKPVGVRPPPRFSLRRRNLFPAFMDIYICPVLRVTVLVLHK
jgi:hypothetical protein